MPSDDRGHVNSVAEAANYTLVYAIDPFTGDISTIGAPVRWGGSVPTGHDWRASALDHLSLSVII